MIPVAPTLAVRPLEASDIDAAVTSVNRLMATAPYSLPLDAPEATVQLLRGKPPVLFPHRWQEQLSLTAWRAGELVGLVNIGAGNDSFHMDAPDYEPDGILRMLALPERSDLVDEVTERPLSAADDYWRARAIRRCIAYPISAGYPSFQAGAGVLPGNWGEHIRILTAHGWEFSQRYYLYMRPLSAPMEEETPFANLSLTQQRLVNGRQYTVYHRLVDRVAQARMVGVTYDRSDAPQRVAHLTDIFVHEEWRERNIGRWLLRRLINDATQQDYREMVIFVPFNRSQALNLFMQHGFQELNYRGYTLERELA